MHMAGLFVLAVVLAVAATTLTGWTIVEVATTDPYLLPHRSRLRWLVVALVPGVGAACWIERGRPPVVRGGPVRVLADADREAY
jgi:hypothetical protein